LQYANLQYANLQYANLQSANLQDAKGFSVFAVQPLEFLKYQPGPIRLFKLVTKDLGSPTASGSYFPVLNYQVGNTVEVPDALTDPHQDCGAGVNVATLDWILREYAPEKSVPRDGYRLVELEFTKEDIACIPYSSNGKIRLHRAKVVAEHDWYEFGMIVKAAENVG
jgi:hypothetical protein